MRRSPMAQPFVPSNASGHHPSRTDMLIPPLGMTFMPLVPLASWSLIGVLIHTSTPQTSDRGDAHVVIFEEHQPRPQVRPLGDLDDSLE